MNFGNNLKDLRETRNITQSQLAEYQQVSIDFLISGTFSDYCI